MADLDPGIKQSIGQSIPTPMPLSWVNLKAAAPTPPQWAKITHLTNTQVKNLLGQIGYDSSLWDYKKIGTDNRLGRYQFSTKVLEAYGLLQPGSNTAYGTDCVNYVHCWNPVFNANSTDIQTYQTYFYNVNSLDSFLIYSISQDYLAYQRLVDLYYTSLNIGVIKDNDDPDIAAGMIYVAWKLGVGSKPTTTNIAGTGAYAWRYSSVGAGAAPFNSGRYAINVLSSS